jgi:hypothetical protein
MGFHHDHEHVIEMGQGAAAIATARTSTAKSVVHQRRYQHDTATSGYVTSVTIRSACYRQYLILPTFVLLARAPKCR